MATMTSTTDFDNAEITQQYSRINTRFELSDEDLDNDNSSARLFERSRIKALAGMGAYYMHGEPLHVLPGRGTTASLLSEE
ncbi:spectrin beta erythrocytic-like protein [Labeo rohita]|uniref:Spectrin beta erythrocytic-like protein n=1 Tax=Labeo rohita TaxID=84645 RepID=A0A498LPW3_LABRO|nr:spectrin beta erythrocytic-like protein [Labeo rohita]